MNLNLYIFTADNPDCLFESNNIEIFNIDDSIAMQGRKKVIRKNVASMEEQTAYLEYTAILFQLR